MATKKRAARKSTSSRKRQPTQAQVDAAESRAIAAVAKLMQFVCLKSNLDHALVALHDLHGLHSKGVKAMYLPVSQLESERVKRHQAALKVVAKANAMRGEKNRIW